MTGTAEGESYPIYLSDLTCEGTEQNLLDCARREHQPTGLYSCDHSHDVAVRCVGKDIVMWQTFGSCLVFSQISMSACQTMVDVNTTVLTQLVVSIATAVKDTSWIMTCSTAMVRRLYVT